ncbi:MAG: hypothetical protein ACFFB2_10315 [Promethearchaeota archaeon]
MQKPRFSVTRCYDNPKRWNVYFNSSKPFLGHSIQDILEKLQYQVLSNTPSLKVFRSKDIRLTWHKQGFIQVDTYSPLFQDTKDIEHLIKDIIDFIKK